MSEHLLNSALFMANHLAGASGVPAAVFDYSARDFSPAAPCAFCPSCRFYPTQCDYRTAHRYGCFEAERWNGLYIYYCPISLTFVSTVVYEEHTAAYAIVSGPVLMGLPEDDPGGDFSVEIGDALALPRRAPAQVTSLAQVQQAVAQHLSGRSAQSAEALATTQASLLNTLYDVTDEIRGGHAAHYPLEIEQKLQRMIKQGDKQGAQELINQLLGMLYFDSGGDLALIKARAKDLIVLFSRSAVDGGADVRQIFGQYRGQQAEIDCFKTLDELSVFLTSIFYRFVGYVFDFGRFEHADIIHKVVDYVRENYAGRLTLEDLAAHVGMSRSYLSTIIREELGATFTDYVNATRVEKSKELLANPALSLAEIADLVGYSDQSYYTKVFSRITGVSPGQYRKKGGEG